MPHPCFPFANGECSAALPGRSALSRPASRSGLMGLLLVLATAGMALPAWGNGASENASWQFQTSADKANQAAVQDMLLKRRSGYYAAPVYNSTTTIERQFNCNVNATAQGNEGTNSTVANSPSNSGAAASSTGNANTSQVGGATGATASTAQGNSGSVGSATYGSTTTSVHGWSSQALNSEQQNHGNQSAQVSGSSACAFGN